jgi:hypothetical protein
MLQEFQATSPSWVKKIIIFLTNYKKIIKSMFLWNVKELKIQKIVNKHR